MANKMTYAVAIDNAIAGNINEEVLERLEALKAQLAKRGSGHKGLTKTQATIRHALKNCMVVILPSIFGNFIGIMSGSLIIEKIFSIPGVGQLYINSINAPDYPLFILITTFYTAIGLAAGIVVDISYGLIDPRIRMGSKK